VTGCGPLSIAVLHRDKIAVEKVLNRHPQYLKTERNIFRQGPIHLAIGWPDGLRLLLNDADESLLHQDLHFRMFECRSTPLDYAIEFGCVESIKLLANSDVAFTFEWYYFVGTNYLDQDISRVVLDIILERLQQLFEFVKQKLPSEQLALHQVTGLESFSWKIAAFMYCLYEKGIQIPGKFTNERFWPWSGIFHQGDIHPGTAMAFVEAGFTDVDYEVEQVTPLMSIQGPCCGFWNRLGFSRQFHFSRYYHIVEFFVKRGGELDRWIPSKYISKPLPSCNTTNRYQVIHRIASTAWAGVIFMDSSDVAAIASLGSSHIWRAIFQSDASDPCLCACTSGGCRPISLALKYLVLGLGSDNGWFHVFHRNDMNLTRILSPRNWKAALELLSNLTLLINGLEREQLVEDVIRFLTFSALGLTHTCCRHRIYQQIPVPRPDQTTYYPQVILVMDPADVEEIRDEEAELIETLDSWVDGFMKEFWESKLPLSQFILGNWQEKMLVELSARDEIPSASREQLENVGVIIHDDWKLGNKSKSDEELARESCFHCNYRGQTGKGTKTFDEWIGRLRKSIGAE